MIHVKPNPENRPPISNSIDRWIMSTSNVVLSLPPRTKVFHIEGLIRTMISHLGLREVLSQLLLCVSPAFRTACSNVFFTEKSCINQFPSLNTKHFHATITGKLLEGIQPRSQKDVAKLLNIIRGTDRGWELFCRRIFLSEQEGHGSTSDCLDCSCDWLDCKCDFDLNVSNHFENMVYEANNAGYEGPDPWPSYTKGTHRLSSPENFKIHFAHEQLDSSLFMVEMRCARNEKKIVFAYGHNGAMLQSWSNREQSSVSRFIRQATFGFAGNNYDKKSRVVPDCLFFPAKESQGVVDDAGKPCTWVGCQDFAHEFKCTVRAVIFDDDGGYKLTTLVNNGALTYYALNKYQCVLPGIPGQVAGANDELFLRFEFETTQMGKDDVVPLGNVCWMHNMNLTFHKGPHARSTWDNAPEDAYKDGRDFNNDSRATSFDVLSTLSTMRWA